MMNNLELELGLAPTSPAAALQYDVAGCRRELRECANNYAHNAAIYNVHCKLHDHLISSLAAAADADIDHPNNVFLDQQLGSGRLPSGWEQCLDLKSGALFYKNLSTGSTTHVDPRTFCGAESGCVDQIPAPAASCKSKYALIQANNCEASPASNKHLHDQHLASGYGYSYCLDYTHRPAAHNLLPISANVDLDLRLSNSLHMINHNLQPTPPSPSSSSSFSLANSLHMNSHSQHSSISHEALMESSNAVNHVRSSSVLSSTSSPSPSTSVTNGDDNDKEEDANAKMSTAACMRCLMFVLVSSCKEKGMRCPQCGCDVMNRLHNL